MADYQDTSADLARLLEDGRDELIDAALDDYDARYEYSLGYTMPPETR